jgi:hypothetical protein
MAKLKLPKIDENGIGMYSYSQHSKWFKNKKEYIRSYFFGESFDGNAYTDFGSAVGEALEHNDFSDFDSKQTKTLNKVTRLDEFERSIKLDFPEFNFYIRGYIDSNDTELTTLIDYKTGALDKESVYSADSYDQLAIYAGAIQQETGKLPTEAYVELIERLGNPWKQEPLTVGNKIVKIPQDISEENIEKVKLKIIKGAKEISSYYKVFNKLNVV